MNVVQFFFHDNSLVLDLFIMIMLVMRFSYLMVILALEMTTCSLIFVLPPSW